MKNKSNSEKKNRRKTLYKSSLVAYHYLSADSYWNIVIKHTLSAYSIHQKYNYLKYLLLVNDAPSI